MIAGIKRNIEYHQKEVKRFKNSLDFDQAAFHEGAVMAFSKCESLVDKYSNGMEPECDHTFQQIPGYECTKCGFKTL